MAHVIIYSSDSKCSECHRSVDPDLSGCYMLLGYGLLNGKPGCGVRWTHRESGMMGMPEGHLNMTDMSKPLWKSKSRNTDG